MTVSTGSEFDGPFLVVSEAPGGGMIAAAGEARIMAPIKVSASRFQSLKALGSVAGRAAPLGLSGEGRGEAADGSVVVVPSVSGARAPASELALKAVTASGVTSAPRRKGAARGRESRSAPGGGALEPQMRSGQAGEGSGGSTMSPAGAMVEALGDLELFGEGPETLLASERGAAASDGMEGAGNKSRCKLEAAAIEAEEAGGHVMRAPIFLWRL